MKSISLKIVASALVLVLGQAAAYADDTDYSSPQSIASLSPFLRGIKDTSENSMTLQQPELKALVTVDESMDPYNLEAGSQHPISLSDTLQTALEQNLDISISHAQTKSQQWKYLGSLGKFLPDLNAGYSIYGLAGNINLDSIQLPNQIMMSSAGFTYNGYQGGKVLFGALQNRNLLHASKAGNRMSISDTLLSATSNYYNLLLNEALLQVRISAVETSGEQFRQNNKLFNNGLATSLDVLQAKTQLSRDRQDLIDQQVARRSSALQLATLLNSNLTEDLMPTDRALRKIRLISRHLNITDLVTLAIDNRPELKQSEELRLAAKKAIVVAAAPLQPTLKLSGTTYGVGQHIGSLSPFYTLAMSINWTLKGLGTLDVSEVQSAKWQARQRLLEASKVLNQVLNEVHNSLISSLQAEKKISETSDEVTSAREELRLSRIRFEKGLGNNLDVVSAQRDLTTAQISKAQSIINFNISQAQLLHDIGLITVNNLTSDKPVEK